MKNLGVALIVLGFCILAVGGLLLLLTERDLPPLVPVTGVIVVIIGSGIRRRALQSR